MDWLIGLLLLVVGGFIGFFVAKYFNEDKKDAVNTEQSEKTVQELMSQQAAMHVQESKKIVENLLTQTQNLKQKIDNYEQLLINQNAGPDGSSLNYFGEHTSAYLRNKSIKPTREKSNADIQPLDFASQSSGLFSGTEKTKVEDTK